MNKQWMQFVDEVKKMYGKDFVPLHEPTFNEKELEEIIKSAVEQSIYRTFFMVLFNTIVTLLKFTVR